MPESSPYVYRVTVTDKDGRPADVSIEPAPGAVAYNEYWTGPARWREQIKRWWRRER